MAIVSVYPARFTEGGSGASISLRKPCFGLSSPTTAAAPGYGAEAMLGEALGELVTVLRRWDPGEDGQARSSDGEV